MRKYKSMEIVFIEGLYHVKKTYWNDDVKITPFGWPCKDSAIRFVQAFMGD